MPLDHEALLAYAVAYVNHHLSQEMLRRFQGLERKQWKDQIRGSVDAGGLSGRESERLPGQLSENRPPETWLS